ncbi:hypothetical protein QT397_07395 [Microbulbifer sp. MKSA007]|uniref:hypothetical protein n=1 Tax=unclassified Microbulbifer TaxID=2619833 RepID=UPI002B2A62CE|nr:hypothetical protein QT397_07395 [Microbulbifer sp. MKSA007]
MKGANKSWLWNVIVAVDQLGNAIAGGNPDATISARCGYFSRVTETRFRRYWRFLERVINYTLKPIDGPDHCYQSYLWDHAEKHEEGSDYMRAVLGVIVILICVPMGLLIRLYVIVFPGARWKKEKRK